MPLLTPHVPSGLIELMKNLTKEVLRDKPQNIYEFAAVHFEKLIQQRDGSLDKDYEQFVAFEAHFDGQQRFAIPPNCERFTCQRPIKIQPISAAKKSKSDMMAGFKAMESINEEDILAENPYTEEKYQKAIYTIQRYYRRYAARKKKSLSSTLTASTAAIIIQRTMRRLFANKIKLKTVGGATTKYDGVLQDDVDNVSEAASYTSSSTIQMLADSQEGRENRLPGREEVLDGDGDVDDSPTEFKEQMTAAKGEPPLVAEEDSAVAATEMDRKSIADENGNNSEDMQLAETTHEHPAPALDVNDTSTAHIGILSTIIGSNDQQNSLRTNTVEIDSNSSDPTPQKKTIPDVEGAGSFPLNVSQSLGATPESFPAATSPRHRPETQETFAVRLQGNGYVENNTAYPYPSGMVQVRKFDPDTGESLKIYDVFYQDKDDPDFSDSLNESTMERDSLENEDLDVDSLESNSENVTHLSGLMKREIGQDDGSLYGDSDEVQQEENVQRMVGLERAPTYLYGIYPERTPMVVRKNISTSSSAGSKKMRHKKELDATLGLGMEDRTSEEESLESKESTSEESSVTQIENVLDRNEEHDGDYLNDIDELNGEHAPSGWEPIQMKATHDFESKPFTVQELEQSAADSLDNKLKTGLDSDARESKHTRQVNEFSDSNVSDQKQTQIPSESYEEEMDSKESSKISSVKPNGIDSKSKPLHKVDVKLKTPSGNSNSTDITSTRDNVSTVNTSAGQTKNDITSETDAEKPDKKQALQNQDKGKYSIDSTKRTQHFVQKQDELSTKTKPAVNGESQKANTFDEIEASHDQRQKRSLNFNVVPQFSGNKGDDNASKEGALKSRSSSLSHQEISTDEKSKETRKATEPQLGVASSDKDAEKESEKEKTNTEHTDNADSLKIVAPAPRSNSPSYFEALYNGQNVNNYPPPSLPLDHGEEMELQLRELQSLNDMYPGLEIRDIIAEFHSKEVQPEEKRHVAHDANNNVKDFEMQSSLEDRASDHYVKHGDEGSLIAVELGKDVPKELSKYTADGSMKKHESNDIVLESEDKTAEASVKKLVKAIAEPLTSETDIGVLKIRSQIPQPKADEFKNNTEDLKVVVHPFGPVALDIAKDEASENSIVTETDDFKHNSEDNFMSTVPDVSSISSEPPRGEKLKKPISKLQETKDSKMLKTAEDKTKTNVNDAPELLNRSDRVLTPSEEINAEAVTSSSEFSGLRNDNINRDGERDFERSRTPTKATSLNAIEESSMIDALKGYKNSVQDYISNEKKNFVEKLTDLFDTEDDQDKDKSISERQAEKSDRVEDLKEKSISAVKTTELTIKPIAPKQSSVSGVANMANDSTSGVTELTIKPIAPKQSSVYGVANMANDSTSGVIVQETKSNLIRDKPDSKNGDEKAKLTTDRIKTQQLVETAIRNTGDLEAELKRQPIMNEFGNGPLIKDADTPRIAVSENEQDLGININTKFLEAEHLNVYTLPQASLESKSVTVPIDITTNDDSIAGTSSSRKPTEPTSTNASEEASIMDTLKSYKNTVQEYIANEKKDFVEKLTDLFDKEDDQDKGKSVSQTQTEKSDSLKDLKEKSISAVKTTELNSKPKTPTELTNPNAIEESSMIDALKGYKSTAQDYISNEKMDFVEKLTDLFDKEDDQDKGKSISQTQAGKSDSLKDLKEKSISAVKTTELNSKPKTPTELTNPNAIEESSIIDALKGYKNTVQEYISNEKKDFVEKLTDLFDKEDDQDKGKSVSQTQTEKSDRVEDLKEKSTSAVKTTELIVQETKSNLIRDKPDLRNGDEKAKLTTDRIKAQQLVGTAIRNTGDLEAELKRQPIMNEFGNGPLIKDADTPRIAVSENEQDLGININTKFLEAEHLNVYTLPQASLESKSVTVPIDITTNDDSIAGTSSSRKPTEPTSTNASEEASIMDTLKSYKNTVQEYISNEKKDFVEKLTDLFDKEDDQDKGKSISETQAEKSDRVEDLKEKSTSAVKTTELTIKTIAPKQSSVSGVANMANNSTSGVTELTIKPIAPKQSSVYGVANMVNDSTLGVIVQETKSNLIRDKPDLENEDGSAKLTADRIKTQQLVETAIRNTGDLEAELKRQPITNEFGNGPLIKDADTPRIAVSENEQDLGININTKFLEAEHLNVYTLPQTSLESKSVTVPIDITTNYDSIAGTSSSRKPTEPTSPNAIEESSIINALKGYKKSAQDYISNEKKDFVEKLTDLFDKEDDQDKGKSISETQAEKSDSLEDLKEKPTSAVNTTQLSSKLIAAKQLPATGDKSGLDPHKSQSKNIQTADEASLEATLGKNESNSELLPIETPVNDLGINFNTEFLQAERLNVDIMSRDYLKNSGEEAKFADHSITEYVRVPTEVASDDESNDETLANLSSIGKDLNFFEQTINYLKSATVKLSSIEDIFADDERKQLPKQHSVITVESEIPPKHRADLIKAAVIIQSAVRGYRTRKALNKTGVSKKKIVTAKAPAEAVIKREQRSSAAKAQKANADLIQAAIIIQSAIRGYRIRKALNKTGVSKKKIVTAKVPVEPVIKRDQRSSAAKAQKANADLIQAAIIIQSAIRGYRIRKALNKTGVSKKKIVTAKVPVQPVIEREQRSSAAKAQKANADLIQAAIIIQSAIRGYRIRKALNKTGVSKKKIVTAKAPAEAVIKREQRSSVAKAQKANADLIQAAIIIQSAIRGHRIRKALNKTGVSKKKIVTTKAPAEAVIKREQRSSVAKAQKANADLIQAAIIIQSAIRGYRIRKALNKTGVSKKKIVTAKVPVEPVIKREQRSSVAKPQKANADLIQAAIIIQSAIRGYRVRKALLESGLSKRKLVTSEAPGKAVVERAERPVVTKKSQITLKSHDALSQAAVIIQSAIRGYRARKDLHKRIKQSGLENKLTDLKNIERSREGPISTAAPTVEVDESMADPMKSIIKLESFEKNQIPVAIIHPTQYLPQPVVVIHLAEDPSKESEEHDHKAQPPTMEVKDVKTEKDGQNMVIDHSIKPRITREKPLERKQKLLKDIAFEETHDNQILHKGPVESKVEPATKVILNETQQSMTNITRKNPVEKKPKTHKSASMDETKALTVSEKLNETKGRTVGSDSSDKTPKLLPKPVASKVKTMMRTTEQKGEDKIKPKTLKTKIPSTSDVGKRHQLAKSKRTEFKRNGRSMSVNEQTYNSKPFDLEAIKKELLSKRIKTPPQSGRKVKAHARNSKKLTNKTISDQKKDKLDTSNESQRPTKDISDALKNDNTSDGTIASQKLTDSPKSDRNKNNGGKEGTTKVSGIFDNLKRDVENLKKSVHEKSATTIQKTFRGYQTRKDLKAHISDQKVSKEASKEEKEYAARIDKPFTLEESKSHADSPSDNQGTLDIFDVEEFQNLALENSATTIQKTFRGYKARKDLLNKRPSLRKAEESHNILDNATETHKTTYKKDISEKSKDKKTVDSSKEKKFQNASSEKPATTIQKTFRGYKTRKDLLSKGLTLKKRINKPLKEAEESSSKAPHQKDLSAEIKDEQNTDKKDGTFTIFNSSDAKKFQNAALEKPATTIQKTYRGYKIRKDLLNQGVSLKKVENKPREKAEEIDKQLNNAAKSIQRSYKGYRTRKTLNRNNDDSLKSHISNEGEAKGEEIEQKTDPRTEKFSTESRQPPFEDKNESLHSEFFESKTVIQPEFVDNQKTQKKKLIEKPSLVKNAIKAASAGTLLETAASTIQKAYRNHLNKNGSTSAKAPIKSYSDSAQGENNFKETIENSDESSTFIGPDTSFDLSDVESVETRSEQTSNIERPNTSDTPTPDDRKYDEMDLEISTSPTLPLSIHPEGHDNEITNSLSVPQGIRRKRSIMDPTAPSFEDIINANEVSSSDFKPQWYVGDDLIIPTNGTEPSSICSSSPSSSVNPLASSSNFKVLSSVDARKENLNSTLQLTPSINSAVVSTSSLLLPSDTEIVHDKNSLKQLNKHSRAVSANKEEHFDEENKSKEIDSIDVKTGVQKLDDYISQEKTTSLDGLPDTEETLNLTSTDAFSVRVEAIEDTKGNEAETSQEITTELCKSCADGIHETDIATIQSRRKSIEPELGKESVREVANGEDTKDDFNSSEKHFDEIKQFVLMEELNPNVNDSINKETEIVNETNGYKNKDDMELSAMDSTNKEQSIDTDDYQLSKSNVITAIGQDKQDIPQSSNNNINGYPSITFIPPSPEDDSSSRESTHASIATESEQMNTNDEEDIPTRIVESIDTSPKGENVENGNEEGEQIKSEKTTDERDNQNKFNDKTHSVDICQEGVTITSGDENNECKQIVGEHQNGDKSNETIATAETNDTRTSSQDGANLRPIVKEELIEKTELVIDATERKKDDSSEIINDVDQQIPTSEGIDLSKPKLVEKNNEEIINAPEFVESAEAALIKNAEQDQKFEDDFNAAIGLGVDEKSVTEDLINKIEQNSVEKSTLRSQSKDEESQIDEKNVQDFISNSDSKDAGLRNVKSKFLSDDDSKEEKEGTQLTSTKSSEDKVDNSSKRISDGSNLSDKTDERRQSEDKATISEATKITINNEAPSVLNASSADVENKSINDKIENKKQENSENRNKQTPSEDGDSESEVETEATRKKRTPSEEQKSLLGTSESLSTEKNNRNNSKDELDSSEQKSGEIMTELKHVNAELESKRSKEDDSLNDMSEIISNGVNKKISEETDEGISKDALPKSLEKEDTLNTKQKEVHSENTKEDEMTKIAKVAPNIIKDKNEVIQPLKVVMPSQEDIEIAAKLLDSSFPVSKEVDSKPEFNYLEETHKAHSKDTPSSSLEEEVPPKAEKKVVYSEITKDDVMDNKPEIAPNIIKDKSKDLQSSKIVMPSQEDIEIAAKLLESSFSHHHLFKFKIENQINAHASEEQKATSKDDNVESKLSHKENQLTTSTDGIYSKNEQAPSNLDEEIQAKLDKLIEENLPLTEADVNTIESNDLPRENAPEEVIEKPCIKKSIPRSPLSTASDPEESELETTTTKADSTTTTPGYDDASDNDVLERPPSMPDTLDAMTAKINETERMVARMHQRRASEHQVSIDSVEQPLAFDESTWEPIKPMQEIQKSSSIEVEDDIILQKLQRGNTTRESSAQSESVIFGDSTESDDIFNHKLEPKTLYRMSTIATDRSTYRPPNLLLKSVTIDDAVKYIDPEKSTEESGSSFCMDDDTSADVRKKMMAYSVSEADSDYYDAGEQTTRIHDDFNISTALENFPSTDTDTTIISAAATKIQAGARGFLTRQRLRRASMGTKSSLTEETKTSFGNDAIGESLDQLVEEEVGKRMPKVQYHRQVGVNSLPSAFGNSNETEIIHSSPTDEDIRTVDDSDGLKLAELTSAAALLPLSTTKNMPHREWSSIDGQREVHRLSTSSENDVNGEIEAEDESAQMPSNLEATLAARRLTLQRGDAMRNDSTPDDDNGNGKQVDATKNMPTTTTTFTQNKSVVESTTTTTTTTKTEKKNYSDTTATTIKMDKIKWFAMRQNSMPVQIDSEVFRVLPKHMRKRIKSAEGEPKKRIRLPRD